MAKHLLKRQVEAIVDILNGWPAGTAAHLEHADQARVETLVDSTEQADAGTAGADQDRVRHPKGGTAKR